MHEKCISSVCRTKNPSRDETAFRLSVVRKIRVVHENWFLHIVDFCGVQAFAREYEFGVTVTAKDVSASLFYCGRLWIIHSSYLDQEVQSAGAGSGTDFVEADVLEIGAPATPFADHADTGAPRCIAACSISRRVKITRDDTFAGSSTFARFVGRNASA